MELNVNVLKETIKRGMKKEIVEKRDRLIELGVPESKAYELEVSYRALISLTAHYSASLIILCSEHNIDIDELNSTESIS